MKKRYFTLEETQKILPEIGIKIKKLIRIVRAINLLNNVEVIYEDEFQFIFNEINSRKNTHKLYYEFYELLEDVLNYGAIVKDLNFGLVDFYSLHEGKEIFLCWQLGETQIRYWHEVDSNYEERKPIELLKNA